MMDVHNFLPLQQWPANGDKTLYGAGARLSEQNSNLLLTEIGYRVNK